MNFPLSQSIAVNLDGLLSAAVCLIFTRAALRTNYPWMLRYLSVRAAAAAFFALNRYGPQWGLADAYAQVCMDLYWAGFCVGSALLFLCCLDVYRQALAPLPGLAKMGKPIFTWVAIASSLVTATTLTSIPLGSGMFSKIGVQLLRSSGAAELCLLALLLLSLNTIGLSARSRPVGMALGLGLMAATNCAHSTVDALRLSSSESVQLAWELSSLLTLCLWIGYGVLPERIQRAMTVPVNSAIYKWDQIASALGYKGTQVAVQPQSSFFLVDVEKVVERAFTRTLKGKESES